MGWKQEIVVPDVSVGQALNEGMKAFPDRVACYFMGVTLTFRELDLYSSRFANYLQKIGCGPGDVVGVYLPNSPQSLIVIAGAFKAGCIVSGVSALLTPKEIVHQLEDSKTRVLVSLDVLFENVILEVPDQIPNLSHIVVSNIADFLPVFKRIVGRVLGKIPRGKVVPIPGKTVTSFKEVMVTHRAECSEPDTYPDDTCLIMYTGGTTGPSKGCEISHRTFVSEFAMVEQAFGLEKGTETFCSGFPFFHVAGMILASTCMASGFTQILVPDPRNIDYLCDSMTRIQPTFIANVPTLFQLLLEEPAFKAIEFKEFKACISGAAPLAAETFRALEAVFGKDRVIEAYGATETCSTFVANPLDGVKKLGSVGLPLPGNQIKVVDLETGTREVPVGEEGEIIGRGNKIMKGYLDRPEETRNALRDYQGEEWLFTGDVGKLDEDGYLYVVDRTKDMILVGGFNVFSKLVEERLYEHPAVALCAVIGAPHPERVGDEMVKACIQLTPEYQDRASEDLKIEITDFCREELAPYKVPKLIEFTDEIPVTPVGKVDKKALRKPTGP
jgi:acyl-CoA synthetase (AMP-forming)/AMP-acid ligase II